MSLQVVDPLPELARLLVEVWLELAQTVETGNTELACEVLLPEFHSLTEDSHVNQELLVGRPEDDGLRLGIE